MCGPQAALKMKKAWKSFLRPLKNHNYQQKAIEYVENMEKAGVCFLLCCIRKIALHLSNYALRKTVQRAPRYPTEQRQFEKNQANERISEEIRKRDDVLISNMNRITVTSCEPKSRWTPTKELQLKDTEWVHRNDKIWEFGFYEPPLEKMPKNKLMFREALEAKHVGFSPIMRARCDKDYVSKLDEERKNLSLPQILESLEQHPAVQRVTKEALDTMWQYFRPFERKEEQYIVNRKDLVEVRDMMLGFYKEPKIPTLESIKRIKQEQDVDPLLRLDENLQNEEENKRLKRLQKVAEIRAEEEMRLSNELEKILQKLLLLSMSFSGWTLSILTMKQIRRVVCAISGGVDSAVSAYLLKKRGLDVVGVHMVNWDRVEEDSSYCPQSADEIDAKKVCNHLQIPFYVTNFVNKYWNEIFTYLVENYRKGRTVVSDVLCNKAIKFDQFHKYAFNELQADAVASGHFARTSFGDFLEKRTETGTVRLLTAVDPIKDQTFFLSSLTQYQLKRSMFPIGSFTKKQIRQIANSIGLTEIAQKPESMGICFIGRRKFDSFIDQYIEPVIGLAKNIDTGKILFEHSGIHHYTIGKRIRKVPNVCQSAVGLFVAGLDDKTQTLWVCQGSHHPALFAREFIVDEPIWISDCPMNNTDIVKIQFRCQRTHPPLVCKLVRIGESLLKVKPQNPIRAAAPGQVCVFYDGKKCLGGGEIQRVVKTLADPEN
ncbi:unnamed protein product [Thelazia callipaeda]|uniref:tRNA-5-taurinomethyluridine 2-sulfurtransferase n=1 Tax=Thelazia callipaeda TaxID=103827 RepID=A0A0N5CJF1_THECL|nr:unnamed protein product [Thelazia callipaeda]